jgi:hypothetical protein
MMMMMMMMIMMRIDDYDDGDGDHYCARSDSVGLTVIHVVVGHTDACSQLGSSEGCSIKI